MAYNFLLNFSRLRWRRWTRSRGSGRFGGPLFFSTNPTFHSDLAINRIGLSKTVINRGAQRVKWNFPFPVPFRTRDLSAIKSTGGTDLDPFRAKIHRCLHG